MAEFNKPPLPFYPMQNKENEREKVTFKRTDPDHPNISTRCQVSLYHPSQTAEELLATIHTFKQTCLRLGWDNGPSRFNNFILCLSGTYVDKWDNITVNVVRTVNNFDDCLRRLVKKRVASRHAFETQKQHLQNIKKRECISVSEFADRLDSLNKLSTYLLQDNDNLEILSEHELKYLLVHAPTTWKSYRSMN